MKSHAIKPTLKKVIGKDASCFCHRVFEVSNFSFVIAIIKIEKQSSNDLIQNPFTVNVFVALFRIADGLFPKLD